MGIEHIHVDPNGNDTSPWDTWAKAKTTIEGGIGEVIGDGDIVHVSDDTYVLAQDQRIFTPAFTFTLEGGYDTTSGTDFSDTTQNEKTTITGKSPTGSQTKDKGLFSKEDAATITWIINNFIITNTGTTIIAFDKSGIQDHGDIILTNGAFVTTSTVLYVGSVEIVGVDITNCAFDGSGRFFWSDGTFDTFTMKNSIVANGTGTYIFGTTPTVQTESYSSFFNNNFSAPSGTGIIEKDPFWSADYHLGLASECISAGDPADDNSNEPVPNGGRINMGAWGNTTTATIATAKTYFVDFDNGSDSAPHDTLETAALQPQTVVDHHEANFSGFDLTIKIVKPVADSYIDNFRFTTIGTDTSITVQVEGTGIPILPEFQTTGNKLALVDIRGFEFKGNIDTNQGVTLINIIDNNFQSGVSLLYCDNATPVNPVLNIMNNQFFGATSRIFLNIELTLVTVSNISLNTFFNCTDAIDVLNIDGSIVTINSTNNIFKNCIDVFQIETTGGSTTLNSDFDRDNNSTNFVNDIDEATILSTNNLSSTDPDFVDEDNGDFHLNITSPAIDAGDPASDFSNEPVPNGGRVNQGRHGNTSEATITAGPTDNVTNFAGQVVDIINVSLTWTNPIGADYLRTDIVRRSDRFPLTPTDGEVIVQSNLLETFLDNDILAFPNLIAFYTVFTFYMVDRVSVALNLQVGRLPVESTVVDITDAVDETDQSEEGKKAVRIAVLNTNFFDRLKRQVANDKVYAMLPNALPFSKKLRIFSVVTEPNVTLIVRINDKIDQTVITEADGTVKVGIQQQLGLNKITMELQE